MTGRSSRKRDWCPTWQPSIDKTASAGAATWNCPGKGTGLRVHLQRYRSQIRGKFGKSLAIETRNALHRPPMTSQSTPFRSARETVWTGLNSSQDGAPCHFLPRTSGFHSKEIQGKCQQPKTSTHLAKHGNFYNLQSFQTAATKAKVLLNMNESSMLQSMAAPVSMIQRVSST